MDRHVLSEWSRNGDPYHVDGTTLAKAFGVESWRVTSSDELQETLARAVAADGPTVVEWRFLRQRPIPHELLGSHQLALASG